MKTGGKQYRVKPGDLLDVEKLPAEEGSYIELGDILAVSRDGELTLGDPMVADASVLAQVRSQYKDTKILVFKYKRKVRYRRKKGHRQSYTRLYITSISHAGEEIALPEWPDKPVPVEELADEAVGTTAVATDEPEEEPAEAVAEVEDVAADEAPVEVVDESTEESAEPDEETPDADVADTAEDGSPVESADEAPEGAQDEPEAPAKEDEAASEESDEEPQSRGDD